MNVGEINSVLKSNLTPSVKKSSSIDFKELILSLFSGEKSENSEETSGDISSLIFSLINKLGLPQGEEETKTNETFFQGIESISSLIQNLEFNTPLKEEVVQKLNVLIKNTEMPREKNQVLDFLLKEKVETPENFINKLLLETPLEEKGITKEEFQQKLISFMGKEFSNEENKEFKSTSLENLGNFKKSVLKSKNYELNSPVNNLNKLEFKPTAQNEKINSPVINEVSIKEDIVKSITFMKNSDIKNLTVKVTPKELGEITISLNYSESKITAEITATNKNTFNLINNNIININSDLSKTGLNIENVILSSLSSDFSSMFSENKEGRQREGESNKRTRGNPEESELGEISDIDGNLNIFV